MFLRLLVAVVLLLAVVPDSALAKSVDRHFTQSFDVSEGVTLYMDHGDGDVTITPWDRDVIDVEVRYRGQITGFGFGGDMDFEVRFHQSNNRVEVVGKEKGKASIGLMYRNLKEFTYTVKAPAYTVLELVGDDGDVSIHDWAAEISARLDDGDLNLIHSSGVQTDLRIQDGDVRVEGVGGDLFVEADDGDVTLINCRIPNGDLELEDGDLTLRDSEGNFQIRLDDGDVIMSRVRLGVASMRTEDGDLELDLLGNEDMNLEIVTSDGSVHLALAEGISATLSLRTDDGSIHVDLPDLKNLERARHYVTGDLRDGRGQIHVNTDDGDVTVRESGRGR